MAERRCHPLRGGKAGKTGEWHIKPDGSGTWTRLDRKATRFSTLWSSGPSRQECHTRVTYDSATGEVLGTLKRLESAKDINALLPEPTPRNIRSVFHFHATAKKVPESARAGSSVAATAWRPTLRR